MTVISRRIAYTATWDQAPNSERAGISVRALRNLESGNGSTLRTLIQVLRSIGRESWPDTIAPVPTVNPLMLTRQAKPRRRASKPLGKIPGRATESQL